MKRMIELLGLKAQLLLSLDLEQTFWRTFLANAPLFPFVFETLVFLKSKNRSDKIKIFGSRSHQSEKFENWIKGKFTNYELIRKGSSIKFCKIAEGKVDIYPRFGPTSEWDIAAGHIILTEAGGKIKSIDQQKIIYNKKESVTNPSFLAYGDLLI